MEIFFLKFMDVEFEIIIIDGTKFSLDRTVLSTDAMPDEQLKYPHAQAADTHTNERARATTEWIFRTFAANSKQQHATNKKQTKTKLFRNNEYNTNIAYTSNILSNQ